MRKKLSIAFIIIGIGFVLYAIFGRYLVLPGYLQSLENGTSATGGVPANVSGWKIARYLLWAYAFKLGIYFIAIGEFIKTAIKKRTFAIYVVAGLIYIALAYMPLPGPKLLFGLGGAVMTIVIIALILHLTDMRDKSHKSSSTGLDLRIFGYFFFAMATYNLCPLLGTRCFALSPELMIKYGLQADAESFASHVLIELVLGWCFVLASYLLDKRKQAASE